MGNVVGNVWTRLGAAQGSASMSARAIAMAVMPTVTGPITMIAIPMGTALAGGIVIAIGTSGFLA